MAGGPWAMGSGSIDGRGLRGEGTGQGWRQGTWMKRGAEVMAERAMLRARAAVGARDRSESRRPI